MTFTTEQLLLIIAAIGVVAVNVINAWRTNSKVEAIATKTEVIKNSVDGTASKQEAKLNAALEKLEFVSARLNKEEQKAAVLAASVTAPSDERAS